MPRKAFRCVAEITVHSLCSPGTRLPKREDVYLTIEMFGEVRQTRSFDPLFPILFHERFVFEKTFWYAADLQQVSEQMAGMPVVIEVRQNEESYIGSTLLAYHDTNAQELLYPAYSPDKLARDREIFLSRTVDFVGLTPKLEFSTYTVVHESTTPYMDALQNGSMAPQRSGKQARRSRSPARSRQDVDIRDYDPLTKDNYNRQTVSSVLHSRSPTADLRQNGYPSREAASPSRRRRRGHHKSRRSPSRGRAHSRPDSPSYERQTVASVLHSRSPTAEIYHNGYFCEEPPMESPEYQNRLRAKQRTRSPTRQSPRPDSPTYERQTVSSVMRSRSPTSEIRHGGYVCDDMGYTDPQDRDYQRMVSKSVDIRPAFAVRRVPDHFLNRTPQLHDNLYPLTSEVKQAKNTLKHKLHYSKQRARSASPNKQRGQSASLSKYRLAEKVWPPPPLDREPVTQKPIYENGTGRGQRGYNRDDAEVEEVLSGVYDLPSTLARTSLSDRYSPVVDNYAERIRRRVDDTLRRYRYSPRPHYVF